MKDVLREKLVFPVLILAGLLSLFSISMTINDVVFHVAQEDLPFGGIGPSGMGAYHGKTGFIEFSHRKAIYTQPSMDILRVLRPPYGKTFQKLLRGRIKH